MTDHDATDKAIRLLRLLDARPHDAEFVTRSLYDAKAAEVADILYHAEQRVAELTCALDVMTAERNRMREITADRDRLTAEVAAAHGLLARAEAAEARVVELQREVAQWQNMTGASDAVVSHLRQIMSLPVNCGDPREPDPMRTGMFRDHNCWKCKNGEQACAEVFPAQCSYPTARNN